MYAPPPPPFLLEPHWFFPIFVVMWVLILGVLAVLGSWRELGQRFRSGSKIDGERYRFVSGSLGKGYFPVNYSSCLFVTANRSGFELSILFLFRVFHPRLFIPWSSVESVRREKHWFFNYTAVYLHGFSKRLLLSGRVGQRILEFYEQTKLGILA